MFASPVAKAQTKTAARLANSPVPRLLPERARSLVEKDPGADNQRAARENMAGRAALRGVAWDFSKISTYPPERRPDPAIADVSRHDLRRIAVGSRPRTVSPDGIAAEDEVTTANGDAGTPPPTPAPTPAPAPAPDRICQVIAGPSYVPSGTIPVTTSGGRKSAHFDMSAQFANDPATGKAPFHCEVRQFIKWDRAFHNWRGGPPHAGFPSSAAADTWIEDRDGSDNARYGHRTGTHAIPFPGCGNEYKTGAMQDMVNGDTYCGNDNPGGPTSMVGQFQFQLKVVDPFNGDAEKASSSVITVPWTAPAPAPPAPPAPAPAPGGGP